LPKNDIMDERIRKSRTTQTKIVFPGSLNDRNILFGGIALKWMDEVAYITATRFLRKEAVTVSVENIKFSKPVKQGDIIEITGKVTEMGSVKLKVQVLVLVEDKNSDRQEKAIEANFWFAAIDENQNPIRITLVKNQEIVKN
jgi:acyl-CoA hydrolase